MSLADARAADEAFARLHEQRKLVGLAPFMTLPPPEKPAITRARLAQFIAHQFAGHGWVTMDDMLAGGFTRPEIETHFTDAKRIARLSQMAA